MNNVVDIETARRRQLPILVTRPKTRGECEGGERPCPWASCKYHLAVDVRDTGTLKETFPHVDVDELDATCALDIADRGGASLDDIGTVTNLTRERVRQIVEKGIRRLRTGRKTQAILRELGDDKPMPLPHEMPYLESESSARCEPAREPAPDDEPDAEVLGARNVWEMDRDDSPARHRAAVDSVWRAYINASIAHGHAPASKDPRFSEDLARVEAHLERKKNEPEEITMATNPTPQEIEERREKISATLRTKGPMNPAKVADVLGIKAPAVGVLMRKMLEDGAIAHNGKGGRGALYANLATDFADPARASTPKRAPRSIREVATKPREDRASGITLRDVSADVVGFKVRVRGVEVECPTALHVKNLIAALGS